MVLPSCLLVDLLRAYIYTNSVYNGIFDQRISGWPSIFCVQTQPEQGLEQPGLVAVGVEQEGI